MRHSKIRIGAAIAAALQLGSALADGTDASSVRAPVYRERGIVSSVPLDEIEKLDAWKNPSKDGEWSRYLSQSRKILPGLGPKGADLILYAPIRCLSNGLDDSKKFCSIPINVLEVKKVNQKWFCKIGIAGVAYGDGSIEDGAGGVDFNGYKLRWTLEYTQDALKDGATGVAFGDSGIDVKFNHRTDVPVGQNPPKAIYLSKYSNTEYRGEFLKKVKKVSAFYYDINLLVKDGSDWLSCNPIDPVVVNTD